MAYKKNYKRRRRSMKKFSIKERYLYHNSRDRSPARFGIKRGCPKNSYSSGFVDAFHQVNNSHGVKREFGNQSSKAYDLGHKRGVKAAKAYSDHTGKPSFTIEY